MAKLSTAAIKTLISTWLSNPDTRKELQHHTEDLDTAHPVAACGSRPEMSALEYTIDFFGAPKGTTREQLEEHIWKMWCDGSRWKRLEKRRLNDDFDSYIFVDKYGVGGKTNEPSFNVDMCGDFDKDAVQRLLNNDAEAKKCILRVFQPDNQLADNYRLEVVTNPQDDAVVGWTVFVD